MRKFDALFLAGAARHYGWPLVPPQHQADVWNIAGAVVILLFLINALWHERGYVLILGAWWAAEELMVIGCSTLYIFRPWERIAGKAQCSSLLGYDLGTIGVLVLILMAGLTVSRWRK